MWMGFYAVITLGSIFWGLYAGALVDGFNRKDVFLGTNFIEGLIVLSVASLGFKEEVLPAILIVMVFTTTFYGYNIHYPNLYAFAQEISDPKDYTRVTSYIEIVGQSTSIAAAALGAILLEGMNTTIDLTNLGINLSIPIQVRKWELHEIFLLDGITYILSFIMIIFIRHKPVRNVTQIEADEGDLTDRLKVGYDYLKKNPLVTIFGICSYAIFIVVLVEIFSLVPIYISAHLQRGGDVVGLTELMYASGSLISGFVISKVLRSMPIPRSIILLTFLTTIAFFICAVTRAVWIFYIVSFFIGFANSGSRIFRVSFLFKLIPNDLTGRVNSIFNVITTVIRIVFILIFWIPFFSQGSNIVYAFGILGCFTLLAGIILLLLYNKVLKLTKGQEQPVAAVKQ